MGFFTGMGDSAKPSGIGGILWEALQLPAKAWTLTLPIFLLTLLSSCLLYIGNSRVVAPPLSDLFLKLLEIITQNPKGPELSKLLIAIQKDLREFAGRVAVFNLVSFAVSTLLLISTLYTFSMTYAGKELTLKGLLVRIARRWYETLITRLYIIIESWGLTVLSLAAIGTVVLVSNGSMVLSSFSLVLSLFALSLYIYLLARWWLSLVITVVEESSGVVALSEAALLCIGNKMIGFAITLLLMVVECAIFGVYGLVIQSVATQPIKTLEIALVMMVATVLWMMYVMAVYTVFYHKCRKSHGLVEGVVMYTSIPSTIKFDAAFP